MNYDILPYEKLRRFSLDVFSGYGFSPEESDTITDVLLRADLSGIESHGIQRMIRYHNEIQNGMVNLGAKHAVLHETPLSAVWDADKSMGQVIARRAMETAIEKAKRSGIGMVSVRNANHYGIAGYYAGLAAEQDLVGVCMCNTEAIGVPVFGKRAMLGTNPIALAFPADPIPFLYDCATTVVPRGKLEVYNKNGKPLPDGWAVDANGAVGDNAAEILQNIIHKAGGGISPLGGGSELHGGHKGYGLGVIVEICTAILAQGKTSNYVSLEKGQADISQFFAAMDYGLFGDKALMKANLSAFLQELRDSDKADGQERIYTHGEKEQESRAQQLRDGLPVNEKTARELRDIAAFHGLDYGAYFAE